MSAALATSVHHHLFWITSRAAGTAALLTSSAAVGVGLLLGGRMARRGRPDLRVAHEALSLATIVAIVVHGASLLGDRFLHPSVADIAIPFASSYKEPWMAIGIIAGWLMIVLGLTYYVRDRIGKERWRKLHRLTALAWIAGVVHALGEGTDAGQVWFLLATAIATGPAAILLVVRTFGASPGPPPARSPDHSRHPEARLPANPQGLFAVLLRAPTILTGIKPAKASPDVHRSRISP
jgi:sulfoxide reductase heme-binding subunit YedZ